MKMHQADELIQDPKEAAALLKEGNERYIKGEMVNKDSYTSDREILKGGQKPFAIVVTCADSRVAPEIFFDQKLGDIFVIRNAGNICDATALGSLEYAVEHLGTRLIVICGHSKCGAVTAAVQGGELPPNLQQIIDHIKPAASKSGGDVDKAIHDNVEEMVNIVKDDAIVKQEGATVVGAHYDVHTGEVSWL